MGGPFLPMGFLVKIAKWLWRGISLVMPFSTLLWGGAVYSGIAYSLYIIILWTVQTVQGADSVFAGWADSVSGSFVSLFEAVNANSFFQFFSYCLSLDVPFEWLRSCSTTFVGSWLSWIVGGVVICLETAVIILGIYFVRSRLKKLTLGLDGSMGNE